MSSRHPTLVRRNSRLRRPKHQSGENFVWPAIKNECDLLVEAYKNSPCQILHHIAILVLASTIVCMQVQICFAQSVVSEKVVQHAYYRISTFASVHCLIYEVIDL